MEDGKRLSPESVTKRCRALYIGGNCAFGFAVFTLLAMGALRMAFLVPCVFGWLILAMHFLGRRERLLDMAEILKLLERQSKND